MEYRELSRLAQFQEWAAKTKTKVDADNNAILQARQASLDARKGIKVGDFVIDGDKTGRVAHDWGDRVQLTGTQCEGSFYLDEHFVELTDGCLDPSIDKDRFVLTDERREGAVWFSSQNHVTANNRVDTKATFRVWKLARSSGGNQ